LVFEMIFIVVVYCLSSSDSVVAVVVYEQTGWSCCVGSVCCIPNARWVAVGLEISSSVDRVVGQVVVDRQRSLWGLLCVWWSG